MYKVVVKEKGINPVVAGRVWVDGMIIEEVDETLKHKLLLKGIELISLEDKRKVKKDVNPDKWCWGFDAIKIHGWY